MTKNELKNLVREHKDDVLVSLSIGRVANNNVSTLLGILLSMDVNGKHLDWFRIQNKDLTYSILSPYQTRKALQFLEKEELISVSYFNFPSERHCKLNWDNITKVF